MGLGEVERLRGEFELELDWRPFFLRPDAPEEGFRLPEAFRAKAHAPDSPLATRAKALGLTLAHREVIPNTRRAHEATEFARAQGRLEPFHAGLLTRYWTHGEDLHDWAVLEAAARDAGLDPKAMREQVEAGAWKGAVQAFLSEAGELGVHAVPTFLVGGRFVIQGAQDALVFRHAFERLQLVAGDENG